MVYKWIEKGVHLTKKRCTANYEKVYTFLNFRVHLFELSNAREGKHECS